MMEIRLNPDELQSKVETLCELALEDVQLRPETILRIFGKTEEADHLAAEREKKHREFLAWLKEDIAMGGETDVE